jgi:hypothetical protein
LPVRRNRRRGVDAADAFLMHALAGLCVETVSTPNIAVM